MTMNANWTWDEYDTLRNKYPKMGPDIVQEIQGRSITNITARAEKLNTHIMRPFTEEELSLARQYHKHLGTALQFLLPDRSPIEIEELLACAEK